MLGKLMKYEIKATARWFIPLYLALLLFALINRLLLQVDPFALKETINIIQSIRVLSLFAYAFLFFGIMVVTLVVIIQRFYKNLLGDEGYLMFTLPVQTWKQIVNKLLVAMLWNFLSAAVGFGSILLIIPSPDFRELGKLFPLIQNYLGTTGVLLILLLGLVTLAFSILSLYTAMALGHLFSKHRLLASFGMYLGINTLSQMVYMLVMPLFMKTMAASFLQSAMPTAAQLNTLFLTVTVTTFALAAASYFITHLLLKRKLNLE